MQRSGNNSIFGPTSIHISDCTTIDVAAKFLEQHFGPHWYTKIDVSRLAMASHSRCILGQLTGECGDWCSTMFGSRHAYIDTMFDHCVGNKSTQSEWVEYVSAMQNAHHRLGALLALETPTKLKDKTAEKKDEASLVLVELSDGYMMWVQALSDIAPGVKFKVVPSSKAEDKN